MAKTMTIKEKREAMERQLDRLNAFETILEELERNMKYEFMVIQTSEDGELMKDEDGEYIYIEPTEESYYFKRFTAYKSAVEEIKALV